MLSQAPTDRIGTRAARQARSQPSDKEVVPQIVDLSGFENWSSHWCLGEISIFKIINLVAVWF